MKKTTITLSEARIRQIAEKVNPLAQLIQKSREKGKMREETGSKLRDVRLPVSGTVLEKRFKGRLVSVKVLESVFEYDRRRFKTLSAVAKAVTGQHMSGFKFFDL